MASTCLCRLRSRYADPCYRFPNSTLAVTSGGAAIRSVTDCFDGLRRPTRLRRSSPTSTVCAVCQGFRIHL
jgi:hypothetical protein